MNDKELLEFAAKAVGIEIEWQSPFVSIGDFAQVPNWDPLTDDGDALRLAVKLRLDINFYGYGVLIERETVDAEEDYKDDPYAATRRAIVRAAAEIRKERTNEFHKERST